MNYFKLEQWFFEHNVTLGESFPSALTALAKDYKKKSNTDPK